MSAAGDEIERRVQERLRDRTVADVAQAQQLREQLGFAIREVHPAERKCDAGPHPIGPVFYGIDRPSGMASRVRRRYLLLCAGCYHELRSEE